jgi:hypothetical protein
MRRILIALAVQSLGVAAALAQGPAVQSPVSVPAAPPSVISPDRPDPFAPAPTEFERRREEERRIREIVRPMLDQLRDGITPSIAKEIQDAIKSQETAKPKPDGQPGADGKPAPGERRVLSDKPTEDEIADARYEEAYAKAKELSKSPDPIRAEEGKIALEQLRRSRMARWSSQEGVFFIGCINQRKYYRDRFGVVFTSDLWFNGSSGAGNQGTTATRTTNAAAAPNRSISSTTVATSVGPQAQTNMALDPCAD